MFQAYRAAFTSAANNGDPAPATGSEEDMEKGRVATGGGGNGRTEAGEKARGAAEEVKEAGRRDVVKDRPKKAGEDVKEAIKDAR